jgi:amino-acid N-acetyltransferase
MLTIRQATPGDLPAIQSLLKANALPTEDLTSHHLDDFIVLSQTSRVLGVIGMEREGKEALVRSLAVEPAMHSRGLGGRLLELIESRAREEGVEDLYLLTTTAAGFFGLYGYERIERSSVPDSLRAKPQFASLCPSSAIPLFKHVM